METTERDGRFDHLFTETVRETLEDSAYGAWRSVSSADAVPLGLGFPFPESFPNDELVDAAGAVFDVEGDVALQYGGGEYAEHLEEVVADRARARGIDCGEGELLLTNGSTHAIDSVCRAFLDPEESIVVEAPTFMGALSVFRNYGVEVTGIDVDRDGLDVEALAAELRARDERGDALPTLVYTIANFQNPTGTTLSADRRHRLLDLAAEYDFVILEDDAYGELRFDGEPLPTLAELDDEGRVVHVGTFSKTIAPGVRTGWVIGHEEIVREVRGLAAGGTNTFTRGVLGRYCAEGRLEEGVPELRRAYEERRDHLLRCLESSMPPEATWTEPEGGFFVWVELPEGIDTEELLPRAAEEGVVYLPGSMFYPDDRGENGLRLSYSQASPEGMERGIAALARTVRSALPAE
ncbi:aminotransferase-like domain-containing protein [Natronorarus salvus]|uniref:aminotransferase-like domain-containing protein n=1 Tax=Natronorarus salvus TaxID=3117733 RepID=UPI002F26C478